MFDTLPSTGSSLKQHKHDAQTFVLGLLSVFFLHTNTHYMAVQRKPLKLNYSLDQIHFYFLKTQTILVTWISGDIF